MARARNIKPAFFSNDLLAEIEPVGRLLFIGLWTISDYKGCIEWRPKRIKAQVLPYDNCDIENIAINLDKSGFIRFYSVQGIKYLKIVNFNKHQNPHKNERDKGSAIPDIESKDSKPLTITGPEEVSDKIAINPDKNGSDRADSLILIPDSPILIPEPLIVKSSSNDCKKVIDGYNNIISDIRPNWKKCASVTDKRKSMIKSALKLVSDRAKSCSDSPSDYLIRLLGAMADDKAFFSGHPTSRNSEGFSCSFETNFTQTRIAQAIDQFAED